MFNTRRFTINFFGQIFSFAVNLIIGFILTPYLIKKVGKEAFGFSGLALNFINYAQLLTIALNSMASRFVSINIHQKNINKANKYFTSVFYSNIFLSIILSILYFLLLNNLNYLINIPNQMYDDIFLLFLLTFFNFIITLNSSIYSIATFIQNRLDLASINSIISNLIRICVLFFCFYFFKPYVWYIGLSIIISSLYLFYSNYKLTKFLLPEMVINKVYFDIKIIKELIKSGIWNVVSKLSGILNVGLDLLLANVFIGTSAMGILSIAKTLPIIILSAFAVLANIFAPDIAMYYASNNIKMVKQQLLISMKFLGILASLPLSFLFVFGDVFFKLWIPNENYTLIHTLSIFTCLELCFALPQEGLWNIFTVTNKIKRSSLNLLYMSILTFITVFVSMYFIDLKYRIYFLGGVTSFFGIIRLVTFLPIYGSICLELSKKTFYPLILKNILSILILTLICLFFKFYIKPNNWNSLFISTFFTSIIGLLFNVIFILDKMERRFIIHKFKNRFNKIK
jgi:O-antigen/teichoic acid export membrane protein